MPFVAGFSALPHPATRVSGWLFPSGGAAALRWAAAFRRRGGTATEQLRRQDRQSVTPPSARGAENKYRFPQKTEWWEKTKKRHSPLLPPAYASGFFPAAGQQLSGGAAGFPAAERLRRRDGRSITPLRLAARKTTTACCSGTQAPANPAA